MGLKVDPAHKDSRPGPRVPAGEPGRRAELARSRPSSTLPFAPDPAPAPLFSSWPVRLHARLYGSALGLFPSLLRPVLSGHLSEQSPTKALLEGCVATECKERAGRGQMDVVRIQALAVANHVTKL